MKKRLLSILFMCCLMLTLLPATAFAEDDTEELSVCTCETACTAESMNTDCPVCGAEGALPEACGKAVPEDEGPTEEHDEDQVMTDTNEQALTDALPETEAIIEDDVVDVETQSEVIDEVEVQLSDEAHLHCICGGSVSAGDHTSHSDVTYTAWNGTDGITYTNNTAYVYLTENATLNSDLVIDGRTLYLCLNGKTLSSNGEKKIKVRNNARLVLCDCQGVGTFKGATKNVWGGACIYLYTSTLDMFGGKLTGGKVTGKGGGGAIALDDHQCTFNMYGGEISGNDGNKAGGAIFRTFGSGTNTPGGTFNMYGGTIKDNKAQNGGAFYSVTAGTVNLAGGMISGNQSTATSNNDYSGGGAIYMRGGGTFTISGTQITGNSAKKDGGAIFTGCNNFTISGSANISNNTAGRRGGAICLYSDTGLDAKLSMTGGTISGNSATNDGGGIYVGKKCTLTLNGSAALTGNKAKWGGATYLTDNSSMTMTSGRLVQNNASEQGGGVFSYSDSSSFSISGGTIESNTAGKNGGAVYINKGTLKISGNPGVNGNMVSNKANNVELNSGKTLTIDGNMTDSASIGITTVNTSYPVAFSNAYATDYAKYFFSDDANAHVEYKDDQKLYLVSGIVARPLTVTFDPNGGTLDEVDKTKSVATGELYGTLPVPSYAGYDFAGWYTEKTGGTEIKEDTTVTVAGTQTLYAHWTPIHVHAYTQQIQKPEALKTPADCTNDAVYYLSCECGEVSANNADIFTVENTALDHDWGEWTQNSDGKTHTRVCKRDRNHTETGDCTGGKATCTEKAVCEVCKTAYGEKNPANHSGTLSGWQMNDTEHWKVYPCCHTEVQRVAHNGGKATCISKATCMVCGKTYGTFADHDYRTDVWGYQVKDGHAHLCKNCSKHDTLLPHTPDHEGHATEEYPILCTECGYVIEAKLAHIHRYTQEIVNEAALKSAATCTAKAVYYKSCACGEISTDDGETFEAGEPAPHSFTEEAAQEAYLKSAATCTERAEYYKSCAACGVSSKGTADEETFFSGSVLGHDYGAWTSNNDGTHTRICSRNASHTETGDCTGGTATCTAKAVCQVCKAAYGEKNPDNHAAGCTLEWTITETEHEQKYSLCGKVITKKSAHSFGDWTIIQEPTSSQAGEKAHICEVCKYKETETVPATGDSGHNDDTNNTIKATAGAASAPQTGDSSQMLLWITLLFVSGFGVAGVNLYGRRKKHSRQR